MAALLFLLIAIFGHNVEGTKIRAIRRQTIQYLPTEIPVQTQYDWTQWRSPVYGDGKLVYSYDGPNGIRFNMHGGYGNGQYQSVAQSNAGGIGLGQAVQGTTADNYNGVGMKFGQTWQNSANGGQINLSSDSTGSHSAASAYSLQSGKNVARSQPNMITVGSDNAGVIIVKDDQGSTNNVVDMISANNEDNGSTVSLVDANNLDSVNKAFADIVHQRDLSKINDNASRKNILHGVGINKENRGVIWSASGHDAISPYNDVITADHIKPSVVNVAPMENIAQELNGNHNDLTSFGHYGPDSNVPYIRPQAQIKPNIWGYYKILFNKMMEKKMTRKGNQKLLHPVPINQYQQLHQYYDTWRQHNRNRQLPHSKYYTYPNYATWPEEHTSEICRKKHRHISPDSEDTESRPTINKQNYILNILKRLYANNIPNVYKNLETPDDVDYSREKIPDTRISFEYVDSDPEMLFDSNVPIFVPKMQPDDGEMPIIHKPIPYETYSNKIHKNYKNVFIPEVRPWDTPDTSLPYFSPYSNINHKDYKQVLTPKRRPNEDESPDIYSPSRYDPSYINLIPKVNDMYSDESKNNDAYINPDFDGRPNNPYWKPNQNYIETTTDFEQNYYPKSNEESQSEEHIDFSEEDDRDVTNDTPKASDSQIIHLSPHKVDKNIPDMAPNKDTSNNVDAPWGWNSNKGPREKLNLRTIDVIEYIHKVKESLIPYLLKLYYSECTRENKENILKEFENIIDKVQSEHCENTQD